MTNDATPGQVASTDLLGLGAMMPACWAWQDINGDRQVSWHAKPLGAHEPLYRREALDRVLAHSREVHDFNEHLHNRNTALMLLISDLGDALGRMVSGMDHMDKLAREWEPDHSSGADRAGWVRAEDASAEAMRLMKDIPGRLKA